MSIGVGKVASSMSLETVSGSPCPVDCDSCCEGGLSSGASTISFMAYETNEMYRSELEHLYTSWDCMICICSITYKMMMTNHTTKI